MLLFFRRESKNRAECARLALKASDNKEEEEGGERSAEENEIDIAPAIESKIDDEIVAATTIESMRRCHSGSSTAEVEDRRSSSTNGFRKLSRGVVKKEDRHATSIQYGERSRAFKGDVNSRWFELAMFEMTIDRKAVR